MLCLKLEVILLAIPSPRKLLAGWGLSQTIRSLNNHHFLKIIRAHQHFLPRLSWFLASNYKHMAYDVDATGQGKHVRSNRELH